MRRRWIVYALIGWLPGVDLAALGGAEELRRRESAPLVRNVAAGAGFEAPPPRPHARAVEREGHGLTVEGHRFLVWNEDPREATQWAAELQRFDRPV